MNQRELAKPEQHACCHAARGFLFPLKSEGEWQWFFKTTRLQNARTIVEIAFCPWCGEKLPDRGRLKVEEVSDGG